MTYFYTYQTMLENGQFYVGVRKSRVSPELDIEYFGSPKKKCENWNKRLKHRSIGLVQEK